jgi:hypothetical protein
MVSADKDDECNELDTWCLAYVLLETVNPINKEKTLRVRYEDGEEQEVCAGTIHRPKRAARLHSRKFAKNANVVNASDQPPSPPPTNVAQQGTSLSNPSISVTQAMASHVRREESLPPARDGHASSMDELSEYEEIVEGTGDSSATITKPRGRSPTSAPSGMRSSSVRDLGSSEATEKDCRSKRRQRMRVLGCAGIIRSGPADPRVKSGHDLGGGSPATTEEPLGIVNAGCVGARPPPVTEEVLRAATPVPAEVSGDGGSSSSNSWYQPPVKLQRHPVRRNE